MAETKALISFTLVVNTKLICVFVFAYADCLFADAMAHLICIYANEETGALAQLAKLTN